MKYNISFTQAKMWSECGHKYHLHYNQRYRTVYPSAPLLYGSAIDEALNYLLLHKDESDCVRKSIEVFERLWDEQKVNDVPTKLKTCISVVYSATDFDEPLLTVSDLNEINSIDPGVFCKKFVETKKTVGLDRMPVEDRRIYNLINWLSLRRKGHIMIESYYKKVIPKIKKVLAVQHKFNLENEVGDTVVAIADIVVEWIDGRILLLDNKTSSRKYESDEASRSQQLIIYYFQLKEKFKLDAVGFIVMGKNIMKKNYKICQECGFEGTGTSHRTCSNEINNKRCSGEWINNYTLDCFIDEIINNVTDSAEELVLSSFDEAINGIKQGVFYKNLQHCKQGNIYCNFFDLCWRKNDSSLIKMEKKNTS